MLKLETSGGSIPENTENASEFFNGSERTRGEVTLQVFDLSKRREELLKKKADLEAKLRALGVDPEEIIKKARADFYAKHRQNSPSVSDRQGSSEISHVSERPVRTLESAPLEQKVKQKRGIRKLLTAAVIGLTAIAMSAPVISNFMLKKNKKDLSLSSPVATESIMDSTNKNTSAIEKTVLNDAYMEHDVPSAVESEIVKDDYSEPSGDTLISPQETFTADIPVISAQEFSVPTFSVSEPTSDSISEPISETITETSPEITSEPVSDAIPETLTDSVSESIPEVLPELELGSDSSQIAPDLITAPEFVAPQSSPESANVFSKFLETPESSPIEETTSLNPELPVDTSTESASLLTQTALPDFTATLERTIAPEQIASPEQPAAPEQITMPEQVINLEQTASPESVMVPEQVFTPESEILPEQMVTPEQTILPTVSTPDVNMPAIETSAIDNLATEIPAVETPTIETPVIETPASESPAPEIPATEISQPSSWGGPVLNSSNGRIQGPSGEETYYNLPMKKVVSNMHKMGFEGEYWVRPDGVKMFGNYVMVAADLGVHPRGSIVETSLGPGIVCDTGEFAKTNHNQLDIATSW